jgi:hypothetical protein
MHEFGQQVHAAFLLLNIEEENRPDGHQQEQCYYGYCCTHGTGIAHNMF